MRTRCWAAALAAACLLPVDTPADELVGTVRPVADSPLYQEITPQLAEDPGSVYVAYTSYDGVDLSGNPVGNVRLRRIGGGEPVGDPLRVSSWPASDPRNDALFDADGDKILYGRWNGRVFESLRFWELQTFNTYEIPTDDVVNFVLDARIDDGVVFYRDARYSSFAGVVFFVDTRFPQPWDATPISDPVFPAVELEVGSDWVVWSRLVGIERDVVAWRKITGTTVIVSALPGIDERQADTDGNLVVFEREDRSTGAETIELVELPAGTPVTIADNGASVRNPRIDGDLVVYESDVNGSFDLFVYRISDGRTFPAVVSADQDRMAELRENLIAFVRSGSDAGSYDVHLLDFRFEEPPCDVDADGDVDVDDVDAIFRARGTAARGPDDPMDANADGLVTVNDARACVLDCTLPSCESPPPACGLLGVEPLFLLALARWRRGHDPAGRAGRGVLQ
jgi:hypothetical protein